MYRYATPWTADTPQDGAAAVVHVASTYVWMTGWLYAWTLWTADTPQDGAAADVHCLVHTRVDGGSRP